MKKTTNFIIICLLSANSIFSQDVKITSPTQNLIIDATNRTQYFQEGDWGDMKINGTLNESKVRQITAYYKSASSSSYNSRIMSLSTNSWEREIRVVGGVYQVYINVNCNYTGCSSSGENSDVINFTYVRPFEASDMYIAPTNDEHITIKRYRGYGTPNLNTGFYFRTHRNTQPTLTGATVVGDYSQDEYFTDTTSERGNTYYYWTEVAMDANGTHTSGILENEYRTVTVATLGVKDIALAKSINISPNPTIDLVNITINNGINLNSVSIFDMNGRLLKTIKNTFEAISIKEFSTGMYLLKIATDKGIISKEIIKK